ncbi:solute carrier, DMT family [Galdieria sulphuraria]|uniref:Solute carrier, DMT family n=1 Tax=Galdieria sulphuraria TaxID=130081 RepID=M2VW66_GALSU|nr:solute carrier, DMT family [Galdieria sulphuraria]EME27481.1 solute carrier, DMT family [Galdieria sulphuraria]|eukprot:XP_005704001.1 solute carrier, DMT family [Galdieria sulphuraria]
MVVSHAFLSIFSILYYISVAFLLNVTNSLVFRGGLRLPCLLIVGQLSLFSLLYLLAVVLGFIPNRKKYLFMTNRLLLLMLFFFVMNLANMTALATIDDVVIFIGVRRTLCLFVLILECSFLSKKPTLLVFFSVVCITLGALWSVLFRSKPFNFYGLLLVIIGNLSNALYLIWIPFASENGIFGTVALTVSLSCWSLPLMITVALFQGEVSRLKIFLQNETSSVAFWTAFGFSSVLGCFISHATYMNSIHNSPLTHSMSGHIKDILIIFIGSWIGIGSLPSTREERMGLALNILGEEQT